MSRIQADEREACAAALDALDDYGLDGAAALAAGAAAIRARRHATTPSVRAEARAEEREACAQVLDRSAQQNIDENDEPLSEDLQWAVDTRRRLAAVIRARGEKP